MPVSEPDTRPGLPASAKLVIGLLAVVGLVSVVRWALEGLFGLLFAALALGVLYVAVKALLRR